MSKNSVHETMPLSQLSFDALTMEIGRLKSEVVRRKDEVEKRIAEAEKQRGEFVKEMWPRKKYLVGFFVFLIIALVAIVGPHSPLTSYEPTRQMEVIMLAGAVISVFLVFIRKEVSIDDEFSQRYPEHAAVLDTPSLDDEWGNDDFA